VRPLRQASRACCGGELQRKRASHIAAEARPAHCHMCTGAPHMLASWRSLARTSNQWKCIACVLG
jgi:hypothetical protein